MLIYNDQYAKSVKILPRQLCRWVGCSPKYPMILQSFSLSCEHAHVKDDLEISQEDNRLTPVYLKMVLKIVCACAFTTTTYIINQMRTYSLHTIYTHSWLNSTYADVYPIHNEF